MADQLFKQVIDGSGNVSFVPAAAENPTASVVAGIAGYMSARAGEQSTMLGAVGGAALAPSIADNATNAIVAGLSGNYVGAAMYGVPAIIGIAGSLAAIFTPEKAKGLTDAQIQTAVAALSHDQLIGLLSGAGTAAAEQHDITVYNTIDHTTRSVGHVELGVDPGILKCKVPETVKTVQSG